jgi:MFS family permease
LRSVRAFEALHFREYRLIWLGQAFASMGRWMDQIARGWLIYQLTNSALQLGLVQAMQALPFLLVSPVAGSAADRYSRKFLLVGAQMVSGSFFAAMALLIFTGRIQPWHVYVMAFGTAIVQTFQQPARAAMIADTVPMSHLTNAIGLNAIVFNMARTAGPALAGVLIALFGTGGSYTFQAAFLFLATVWTLQLRPEAEMDESQRTSAAQQSLAQSIVEGWKFSWTNETVRASLLIAMFASLFVIPFVILLPVFARDLLDVGASGQGFLLTAMGVGAFASSVLIATMGHRLPRGIFMLSGVTIYSFLVVLFAISHSFEFSVALMALVGLCHVMANALVQTVIQTYSPSEFRGRAIALFQMGQVFQMVGGVFVGALAGPFGARWAVAIMSILGTFSMAGIYFMMPKARLIQ